MEKDLLFLLCRHHIYEVIYKGAFELYEGKTQSPNITEFDVLRDIWDSLNRDSFKTVKKIKRFNKIRKEYSDFKNFHEFATDCLQVRYIGYILINITILSLI